MTSQNRWTAQRKREQCDSVPANSDESRSSWKQFLPLHLGPCKATCQARMAADEEFKTGTEPPEKPKSPPPERRGRRPGRGYRGRGRRPQQHQQPPAGQQPVAPPPAHLEPSPTTSEPPVPASRELEPPSPPSPATIQSAIDDVNQIIGTLRDTLVDMEEVLETLELVERQNNADERELESLRRALRTLHRPREGGSQPARGHS